MKVIDINKHFCSETRQHYLVLTDNFYSDATIDSLVEDWCENDPCGHGNGYSFEWHFITDNKKIKEVLENELILTDIKIEALNKTKDKVETYLMYLKYY